MNHDAILEKLKKLLRMKRGGTPEEIATALHLAQRIADEHGINLDSVNADEAESQIGHEREAWKRRASWEETYSAMICDAHFNVSTFWEKSSVWGKRVYFVGTELDRKIAIYVYHFLVGHFRREWNSRRGRIRNRRSFMYGAYLGLGSKLRGSRSEEDSRLALARTNRSLARDQYCTQQFGKFTSRDIAPDTKATAAMNSGWSVGRKTEIRPAVETAGVRGHLPAQTGGGR